MIISIFMHSRSRQCNAFQSMMGIFLHSSHAPEKLINILSQMGISISSTSIHRAVKSLSVQSQEGIQSLGQSLLAGYAYDNFDVKFNISILTIDTPKDSLIHLTSGLLFWLNHNVYLEDLKCSHLLWDRAAHTNNPLASDPHPFNPLQTFYLLYNLHPEPDYDVGNLSRRGQFRTWMLCRTLLLHGPLFFHQYISALSYPDFIEAIPPTKLDFTPFRAMDYNQSKVSGNIEAIMGMLMQAAVGDPTKNPNNVVEDL